MKEVPSASAAEQVTPRFLTAENLAKAGLFALMSRTEYRAPKEDMRGNWHGLDGKFMNRAAAFVLVQTVSDRIAEKLLEAEQRRAATERKRAILERGTFASAGSKTYGDALTAYVDGAQMTVVSATAELAYYKANHEPTSLAAELVGPQALVVSQPSGVVS